MVAEKFQIFAPIDYQSAFGEVNSKFGTTDNKPVGEKSAAYDPSFT